LFALPKAELLLIITVTKVWLDDLSGLTDTVQSLIKKGQSDLKGIIHARQNEYIIHRH